MEVVNGLYFKLLPCQKKHPGGQFEFEYSYASTSLKPKLVAAASQPALPNIDILPATSLQLPLSGLEYPKAPTSFLRQEPPPMVE